MSPFIEALKFYEKIGDDLMKDIAAYSTLGGYVFITPHSLMFCKEVKKDNGTPDTQWNVCCPDAWYVRFAVGKNSISEFISKMPHPLPFVGWSRVTKSKNVKWYNFNRIIRRK